MLKTTTSIINASQITGVLPVLNGGTGVTTKTGTGNVVLSTAPTLSGDVSLSTGNLVQGTAAKGVNFTANTPSAGMTSQLLNWYEEGTWTPDFSAWTTAPSVVYSAKYTRVGNLITVQITANQGLCGAGQVISGLPYTVVADGIATMRDISGGTAFSIAVSRGGSNQIQSALAVNFGGLNWVLTSSYFT